MNNQFILAISTSSGIAKVAAVAKPQALGQAGNLLFSFQIKDYKSQSAQLLPLIQQHSQEAGLQPAHCAAIAVDVGPGGFTSLRTACGVAQGLAVAWNVPTVPLSSFECMLPTLQHNEPLTVLIDARLNEIYAATIYRTDQGTQWDNQPYLFAVDQLREVQGPVVCDQNVFGMLTPPKAELRQGSVSAVQLAQLAWQEFEAGRVAAPFDCQPMYVREKVALTTSERLALKHGAV